MKLNRKQFYTGITAAAAIAAAGGSWLLLREPNEPVPVNPTTEPRVDRLDLLTGGYAGPPHLSDPEMLVMLSLTGGEATTTTLELRTFDLEGSPMDTGAEPVATLSNLITGEETSEFTINRSDDSWELTQSAITSKGWWQLSVQQSDLTSTWTFHIPDPNILGADAVPEIETEPDAQAMLAAALNVLSNHGSLRWWQWLSSGAGAIVLSRFSVTTPESNGLPPSFESDALFAGRIPLSPADGELQIRQENSRTVSIGDEGRHYSPSASPESVNGVQYLPIDRYHTTYEDFDGAHFGMTSEFDGKQCQLVAFHLFSGFDTWFAFWIEIDSLIVRELFMVSTMHYMHWIYLDIDESVKLTF